MIEEKLQKCRVELQKRGLKKSGENKYAKFKYFELGDFIPVVNEIFADNKMFSNFSIQGDIATLTILDCEDKSTQIFTSNIADADVKGCTAIQSLGAVHTYLRRYLYLNALEIVENDPLDASVGSEAFKPIKAEKPKTKGASQEDYKIYVTLAKINDIDAIKSFYETNKENVTDRETFHKRVCERIKELKRIASEFDEAVA